MDKKTAKELSPIVAKAVFGERLTSQEHETLKNNKTATQVVNELSADKANTVWKDTVKNSRIINATDSNSATNQDAVLQSTANGVVGGDADDLLLAARLLQELVGVEEDLGAERLMGGAASVLLQAVGQRPRDEGGDEHDAEGDHVFRFVGVEAEFGFDEEVVEQQHAQQGADAAEHGAHRHHGDDEHPQDEHRDDVGKTQFHAGNGER